MEVTGEGHSNDPCPEGRGAWLAGTTRLGLSPGLSESPPAAVARLLHGWAGRGLAKRWRGGRGGPGRAGRWRGGRGDQGRVRRQTAGRARGTSSARGWGRRVARAQTHIMLVGHAPLLHVQHLHLHDAAPRRHGRFPRPAPCGPGLAEAIRVAEH